MGSTYDVKYQTCVEQRNKNLYNIQRPLSSQIKRQVTLESQSSKVTSSEKSLMHYVKHTLNLVNASDDPFDTTSARQLKLNRVARINCSQFSVSINSRSSKYHKSQNTIRDTFEVAHRICIYKLYSKDEASNQRVHAYVKALQIGQYHSLSFQDPGYSIMHSRPKNYNAVQFLQALEFILSETTLKEVKLINLDSTSVALYCEEVTILAARYNKRKSQSQVQIKVEIADHEQFDDQHKQNIHNNLPSDKQQVTFEQLLQQVHITDPATANTQINDGQTDHPEIAPKAAENIIQIRICEPEVEQIVQEDLTMTFGQNQGKAKDLIDNVLQNINDREHQHEEDQNNQKLDTHNQIVQDENSNSNNADAQNTTTNDDKQESETAQAVVTITDQIVNPQVEDHVEEQQANRIEIDEQKHSDIVFSTDTYVDIAAVKQESNETQQESVYQHLIQVEHNDSTIYNNTIQSVIIKEITQESHVALNQENIHQSEEIHTDNLQIVIEQNELHQEKQAEIQEPIHNQVNIIQETNLDGTQEKQENEHNLEQDHQQPLQTEEIVVVHNEQENHQQEVDQQQQQTETITHPQLNSDQKDKSKQKHHNNIHLEINRESKTLNINIDIHQNPKSPIQQESPLKVIKEESSEQKQVPDNSNLQETILVISRQILSELTEKAIAQLIN